MLIKKNNYFKSILLLIIFVFLFLTLGAQFLHNHSDPNFHDNCPACSWLVNSIFIFFVGFVLLGLFLCCSFIPHFIQVFITYPYEASRYLRSPPISS